MGSMFLDNYCCSINTELQVLGQGNPYTLGLWLWVQEQIRLVGMSTGGAVWNESLATRFKTYPYHIHRQRWKVLDNTVIGLCLFSTLFSLFSANLFLSRVCSFSWSFSEHGSSLFLHLRTDRSIWLLFSLILFALCIYRLKQKALVGVRGCVLQVIIHGSTGNWSSQVPRLRPSPLHAIWALRNRRADSDEWMC